MPPADLTKSLIKRRTRKGGSAASDAALSPPTGSSHFRRGSTVAPGVSHVYPKSVTRGTSTAVSSVGSSVAAGIAAAHQARVARQEHRQRVRTRKVRKARRGIKQARKAISKQQKALSKPLPGLDTRQTRVAEKFLSSGLKQGASKKQLLSGTETGLVETSFHNLAGGDGSSVGVRQETAESYPNVNRRNVRAAGKRYFSEAKAADVGQSAGSLAQDVQRSAYPDRYAQVEGQAKPIVRAYLHRVKKSGGQALVPKGPMKATKLPGPWEGSRKAVAKGLHDVAHVKGGKRTPAENSAVGGSPTSDHLTTNKATYAKDVPATGSKGTQTAFKVARNLGIKNFSPGNYNWYTSPKAPGYRFQILWQVEGHFDHVHVGAEYVGAGASGTTSTGTGTYTAPAGTLASGAVSPSGATNTRSASPKRTRGHAAAKRRTSRRRKQAASAIGRYRRDLKPIRVAVAKATSTAPSAPEKISLGL